MGTRTPDFRQAKICPELQVPQGTKDAPKAQRNTVPWVVLGLVTSQFSTVKNGAVRVIKRGLTLGRFPGWELKNKRKAT